MISYCIAVYRPVYARRLIDDLCTKTRVPYEILLWINCVDAHFDGFLAERIGQGCSIRIVGRTPQNIGMAAYFELFRQVRYELFAQIDDDVVCVSPDIAERAAAIFASHRSVRQLVADVWQDEYTTGARPEMSRYREVDVCCGLYDGPIDGWFSVCHRSVLNYLPQCPAGGYFPLGTLIRHQLRTRGLQGLLCTRFKVFHVIGPQYSAYFGMLDFEIEKYRRLGRDQIVSWYEAARAQLPDSHELARRVDHIFEQLTRPVG